MYDLALNLFRDKSNFMSIYQEFMKWNTQKHEHYLEVNIAQSAVLVLMVIDLAISLITVNII